MSARCFLCGASEVSPQSHVGSPLCSGCLPAGEHVVHMSNPGGMSVAECDCGWRSELPFASRGIIQDAKVRLHWRDVIRRALEGFDAIHGHGAAKAQLAIGFVAVAGVIVNTIGLLVALGAGA